jgi:subtilase family serine protease
LKVGALFDSMLLPVTTTAAGAQKAFGVTMHSFRLASGKVVNANVTAVHLPSSIAPFVSGVVGLDNLVQLQPLGTGPAALAPPRLIGRVRRHPGPGATERRVQRRSGEWDADAIAQAYDFGPLYQAGDFGQGQTVALFEGSGYSPSDVAAYQACYGTSVPIQIEPTSATNGLPSDEANIDIEDVVGLAPKITQVLVYEVQQGSFPGTYGQIASDDLAQVVSSSWGTCEANSGGDPAWKNRSSPRWPRRARACSRHRVTRLRGMQRTGSEPPFDDALAVGDPASQPFVTGVGGTALTRSGEPADHSPHRDRVELEDQRGFAFSRPPRSIHRSRRQQRRHFVVLADARLPAGHGRHQQLLVEHSVRRGGCPGDDVHRVLVGRLPRGAGRERQRRGGDGVFTGAPHRAGRVLSGTSLASPTWAAMTALINASTSTSACDTPPKDVTWGSVGFLNPALYQLATSTPSDFNDITATGNNDMTGTNSGAYPTTVGYDMATGLGSPVAANLAQSLCPRTPITVTVSGSQTYNSSSPTFSQTTTRRQG